MKFNKWNELLFQLFAIYNTPPDGVVKWFLSFPRINPGVRHRIALRAKKWKRRNNTIHPMFYKHELD
jgi:hypothetical protein